MIMGVKNSDVRIAKNDGIASWPALTAVSDSPKMAGVYYTGSDDGIVSATKDGGKTWDKTLANRMPGFVKGGFVSRIQASRYDAGTVYITQDAHRSGETETHIWVSKDLGATFTSINNNLKGEVSWIAPIARALIKSQVGDVVKLLTPAGLEEIEVLEVSYPSPNQAK